MRIVKVNIDQQDSEELEVNEYICSGYCHLLTYIFSNANVKASDDFLNEKWQEAVQYEADYAAIEHHLIEKYKPEDGYIDVRFNFDFNYMEYIYA